jgi:hypothetical protein
VPIQRVLSGGPLDKFSYRPGHIQNEYSLFLPGERQALNSPPRVAEINHGSFVMAAAERPTRVGESAGGWKLLAVADFNDAATAVFEKHMTHRGAVAFVTEERGVIANIPKLVGRLANIRPRQINTSGVFAWNAWLPFIPAPTLQEITFLTLMRTLL